MEPRQGLGLGWAYKRLTWDVRSVALTAGCNRVTTRRTLRQGIVSKAATIADTTSERRRGLAGGESVGCFMNTMDVVLPLCPSVGVSGINLRPVYSNEWIVHHTTMDHGSKHISKTNE
jgi:hypothetical protein